MDLNLRKKLSACYNCSLAAYGAETWTLWKVVLWKDEPISCTDRARNDETQFCRRTKKISWTDRVRSDEAFERIKDELHNLQTEKEGRVTG